MAEVKKRNAIQEKTFKSYGGIPAACPSNTVLAPPHAPSSKPFALCVVALLFGHRPLHVILNAIGDATILRL